ncbi:MAG TPA: hypothetical protein PKV43_08510, partial [Armatimonadota bacterium]|nr:hypothetical protein [Armatimonadota bacterium]
MSTLPAGHGDDPVEAAIERLIKIKCLDSELFELLQSGTTGLESSEDHNINNLVSRLVQLLEAQQSSIAELRAENEGLKTKLGQADTQQQELSDL